MARKQISHVNLAKILNVSKKTLQNKIREKSDFKYAEVKILQNIFDNCSLEYLFESFKLTPQDSIQNPQREINA